MDRIAIRLLIMIVKILLQNAPAAHDHTANHTELIGIISEFDGLREQLDAAYAKRRGQAK